MVQAGVVVITHPFFTQVIHDRLSVHRGFGVNVIGDARFGFKVIVIFLPRTDHGTGNRNIFFQFLCPVKAHNLIVYCYVGIPVQLRLVGTIGVIWYQCHTVARFPGSPCLHYVGYVALVTACLLDPYNSGGGRFVSGTVVIG